jgi:hypothetical protein
MPTTKRATFAATGMLCLASVKAFTVPSSSTTHIGSKTSLSAKKEMFFATESETEPEQKKGVQLFSDETLQEANDALSSVGWGGMAPASSSLSISEDQMGELTSDDPFVKVSQSIFILHMNITNLMHAKECVLFINRKSMNLYRRRWVLDLTSC